MIYCDVVSKVLWMNPKYGTQGFLLKFTPGFRQAWAKMLDVEGGFNPLVKVSFQLLLYFSDILCWSSPLLGYCPRLLRLHIRAADVWEGRRQQGVCLSVRILQIMEIHAFTPRKYGSRNTTRWNLRKKSNKSLPLPSPHCNLTVWWICGRLRHPARNFHKQVVIEVTKLRLTTCQPSSCHLFLSSHS